MAKDPTGISSRCMVRSDTVRRLALPNDQKPQAEILPLCELLREWRKRFSGLDPDFRQNDDRLWAARRMKTSGPIIFVGQNPKT